MATGTWELYASAVNRLNNAEIDWETDTNIYATIATSAYTPNQGTHDYADDVTPLATGATDLQLTSKTVSTTGTTRYLDAADLVWPSSTITNGRVIVIYKKLGGASSADPLIAYCVLDADVSSVSGNWTHTFDASGIVGFAV